MCATEKESIVCACVCVKKCKRERKSLKVRVSKGERVYSIAMQNMK